MTEIQNDSITGLKTSNTSVDFQKELISYQKW